MATKGSKALPVQGGFLLVRPDLGVYDELRAIVREARPGLLLLATLGVPEAAAFPPLVIRWAIHADVWAIHALTFDGLQRLVRRTLYWFLEPGGFNSVWKGYFSQTSPILSTYSRV